MIEGLHEACTDVQHPCFACKMAIWRAEGVGIAPIPADWGGPTVRERVADTITQAKANGYEPDYAGRAVLV